MIPYSIQEQGPRPSPRTVAEVEAMPKTTVSLVVRGVVEEKNLEEQPQEALSIRTETAGRSMETRVEQETKSHLPTLVEVEEAQEPQVRQVRVLEALVQEVSESQMLR